MLNYEDFAAALNTEFVVRLDDRQVAIELVELTERKTAPGQEYFSVVFRGPVDQFLPQMTYDVTHEKYEPSQLFLVPIGQKEDGFLYQAVFNRLVEG
jgi:hypothetical protein